MRFITAGVMVLGSATSLLNAMDLETNWSPFISIGYAPSVNNVDHTDFKDKGGGTLALGAAMKQTYANEWGYKVSLAVFDTYGKANGDAPSVSGESVKTNDLGLVVDVGPTYNFTPDFAIALLPFVGGAWARFNYSGGYGSSSSDNGVALVYGAKLALIWAINHGFTLGIYGGFEGTTDRMNSNSGPGKYTATGIGPIGGLSFGWLF